MVPSFELISGVNNERALLASWKRSSRESGDELFQESGIENEVEVCAWMVTAK